MAIKKKAVKTAAKKPVPKKTVPAKSAKKAVPSKKAIVSKKAGIPTGKFLKPVAKGKVVPSKNTGKPLLKNTSTKKIVPTVKSVTVKRPLPKSNKSISPATKKPIAVQKPVQNLMVKKTEEKKITNKVTVKPTAIIKAAPKNVKDIKVIPLKPVILPKINTKTSRTYQPDFTKSVLDQPRHDPGAPIVRYNDTDLAEFRELIGRKLDAARKELNYLQGLITRKDEMGGDESDNRYMTMEDGSLSMEREQLSQMASRQITFIDHLEKALMRIENKTYGICRVTGKLIDKARLRAVPHATLSIEAKMGMK